MGQVHLWDESVDAAVFCLSLEGTNVRKFSEKEVKQWSPESPENGWDRDHFKDVQDIQRAVSKLDFKVISKDLTSSHFLFDFQQLLQLSELTLQPPLYEHRWSGHLSEGDTRFKLQAQYDKEHT